MGNSESIHIDHDIYSWDENTIPKIDKTLFGNARLIIDKGSPVILKTRNIEDPQTMKIVKNYLNTNIISSGIFTTTKAEIINSKNKFCGSCSGNIQLQLEFEYHRRDLFNEILQRCSLNVKNQINFIGLL